MFKQTIVALGAIMLVAPSAMAVNYPKESYDAKYEVSTNGNKTAMRMASDGQGHFLTETTTGGQNYTSIVDYTAGTSTALIPQGKMAMKTKLPATAAYVAPDAVKDKGGKSLGSKTVNGHPCHGYEYASAGTKTQTWIGDDCKIVVQSITDSPAGKSTMELKNVGGKPSADAFKIPAGYKLMGQ